MTFSDKLTIFGIVFGLIMTVSPYLFGIKGKRRKNIRRKSELLRMRNWNNLGDLTYEHPYPAIEINVESSDHNGVIQGTITNCECESDSTYDFLFEGKLNHKGVAYINIQIQIGHRRVNVGKAKIVYRESDNTLDYYYISGHKDNPSISWEVALPRFNTFGLIGC